MSDARMNGICIFDESGQLLFSNSDHARMIGGTPPDVIGKHWRDWTPKAEMRFASEKFAESVSGNHVAFMRVIERTDGSTITGLAQLSRIKKGSKSVIIGCMRMLSFPDELLNATPTVIANYVADTALRLKVVADEPQFASLRRRLDELAVEAGLVVHRIAN